MRNELWPASVRSALLPRQVPGLGNFLTLRQVNPRWSHQDGGWDLLKLDVFLCNYKTNGTPRLLNRLTISRL